jgi:hypothetical protein
VIVNSFALNYFPSLEGRGLENAMLWLAGVGYCESAVE